MKTFEITFRIGLVQNPNTDTETVEAVAIVRAKTKREARRTVLNYPHFKEFVT